MLSLWVGSTLALGLSVARADFTVNSWNLRGRVRDASFLGSVFVIDTTVSNVFSETRTATQGGSFSTTIYDFAFDAAGGSFDWDFDHQRVGARLSFAQSFGDPIRFTVTDVDMLYDFSGAYSMIGNQQIFGQVF